MRDLTNKEIRKKLDTLEGSIEGLAKDVGKVNKQQTKIDKKMLNSVTDWVTDVDFTPGPTDVIDLALQVANAVDEEADVWEYVKIFLQAFASATHLDLFIELLKFIGREDLKKIEEINTNIEEFKENVQFYEEAFSEPQIYYGSHIDISLEGNNNDYEVVNEQDYLLMGYYSGATFGPAIEYANSQVLEYEDKLPREMAELKEMREDSLEKVKKFAELVYEQMLVYIDINNPKNKTQTIEIDGEIIERQKFSDQEIAAIKENQDGIIELIQEGIFDSDTAQAFIDSEIWDTIEEKYGMNVNLFQAFSLIDSYAYQKAQTDYLGRPTKELLQFAAQESVFGVDMLESRTIMDLWDDWDLQLELVQNIQKEIDYWKNESYTLMQQRDSMDWIPKLWKDFKAENGHLDPNLLNAGVELYSRNNTKTKTWYDSFKEYGGFAPSYGHMALGSQYAPGGFMEVGEHGPEIAYIPEGAKVFTNSYSKQLAQETMRWIKEEYEKNQLKETENQNGKPLMREDLDEIADYVIEKLVRELEATIFNMP